ncbi:MAG: glycoside hydrolase family 95 protein, partial [Planctomycetia bacterium]|nr:glycoside hydrolase family 95 protein [Planctomycetia bacterium]
MKNVRWISEWGVVCAILFISPELCVATEPGTTVMDYDRPARMFTEALPLGNGRLGATVYGDPVHEQIVLNEDTVWAGGPHNNLNPEGASHLAEIRKLLFDGKYSEAQEACQKFLYGGTDNGMPYQVAARLRMDFPPPEDLHEYRRTLDLDCAVATTEYQTANGAIVRKCFTSFADDVIVLHLRATGNEKLNFNVKFETPETVRKRFAGSESNAETAEKTAESYIRRYVPDRSTTALEKDDLRFDAITSDHEGVPGQVVYHGRVRLRQTGGTHRRKEHSIEVEGASEVLVLIDVRTNFIDYRTLGGDPVARATEHLDSLMNRTCDELQEAHIAAYQPLFRRVSLDLGTTSDERLRLPVDQRVQRFSDGFDPDLVELLYQFGRYLLLSSSMPGTQPATLQGIWCEEKYPPWDSKYTVNANTPMNYWPSETTNLAETHEPLVKLVQEMTLTGADAARTLYGCRGWVFHHNTDLWRISGVVDGAYYGQWVGANAWFCHHLWDRYRFNGDREYLRTVYPVMRSACEFFLDFLVRDPETGKLLCGPSNSPENAPASYPGI